MISNLRAFFFTSAMLLLIATWPGAAAVQLAPQGGIASAATGGSGSDSNARAWADAQRLFSKNDFAQAQSAAGRVTSGPFKADAQAMLVRIRTYSGALQDGTDAELRHDPVAAIRAYAIAANIKSDGPGDPAARIVRVQGSAAAWTATSDQAALHAAQLAQRHQQAARLAEKGKAAEQAGDLQAAANSYAAALAADPGNAVARAGSLRLKAHGKTAPEDEAKVGVAIRTFYNGDFADAEQQLTDLSKVTGSPWRGVAYFYLGAARWYGSLQQKQATAENAFSDPETHAAFAEAKTLGYAPQQAFISPALLRFWQSLQ